MTKEERIKLLIEQAQKELAIIMDDVRALNLKLQADIDAINNG